MADLVRVSGTRQVTPTGPHTISSPAGEVVLDSTSTIATGDLTVRNDAVVEGDARIVGKIQVSTEDKVDTNILFREDNTANVGNPLNLAYNPFDVYDTKEHRVQGGAYFPGGVGIEKDLNVGGYIYGRITYAQTTTQIIITATNQDYEFYPIFAKTLNVLGTDLYGDDTGEFSGLRYNPAQGTFTVENIKVTDNTPAVSTTTGALRVHGGVGIEGQLHVDEIYTKIISSINSKIQIAPQDPLTEIVGDIRVLGQKPIGTAPVVTNVLYVTVDGNDTNDGRAMDPSRACRTIGGAMSSPYYQPGTQIQVSAGHYLEDNPLLMKPYTSVKGSDIRTTFIEPINKTQDLFHMNSGCYLNYMTFLNGRSGLLEGAYAPGFNRGAYCTAFPPLAGDDRIDLFQSPYVQNCTNQSGPWLKDGTMFVPNQTVQVPLAVVTGSWPANTSTLVVKLQSGTIEQGMHINAGQQNPGFFNARTLLLANKSFMQDQVVSFVDNTFNSGSFTYNTTSCSRDVGLIVDSIAMDLMYNSTSDSVFAGLQYWSQGNQTVIPGEEIQTISAITYARGLAETAVGATYAPTVANLFSTITNILIDGAGNATNDIVANPNGLASDDPGLIAAYNALLAQKSSIQTQTINYINTVLSPAFSYDQAACSRDTGLIVDSIVQDLLFDGDSQSTFAGLQYWGQSVGGYTGNIAYELTTTTAAINYISSLTAKIVQGIPVDDGYQSAVKQVTSLPAGSLEEAQVLTSYMSTITNILQNGTTGTTNWIVSNSITPSTSTNVRNAYTLLQANKDYLKAEAIAFVDSFSYGFYFGSSEAAKCYRDTGLIVDAIVQDVLFNGTSQSEFAGLQYWSQSTGDYVGNIEDEITTTTNAILYISDLAQKIVQNIEITDSYNTGVVAIQSTSRPPAGISEANIVYERFDTIVDILKNGTAGVTDRVVPNSITPSSRTAVNNAYLTLADNLAFIKDKAIAYINATKTPGFTYNETTCRRDIEYIVDSVRFDLLYGGNKQSIQSGVYYYTYSTSNSVLANTGISEVQATLSAYQHIGSMLSSIMGGVQIVNPYQTKIKQVTGTGNTAAVTAATDKVDLMLDIIENGPSVVSTKSPIDHTASTTPGVVAGVQLLHANREFIQAEVVAYVRKTKEPFRFGPSESAKCARDTSLIVESIVQDMIFDGDSQSTFAGLQYWSQVNGSYVGNIENEITTTTSAINYISSIAQKIVQNITVTDLYTVGSTQLKIRPAATPEVATTVGEYFSIITNILLNGTAGITDQIISNGTSVSTVGAILNAAYALQDNLTFIKDKAIAYINATKTPGFTYDETTCRRDIGYIIDSIKFDLLYGGNKQSIQSGVYYYDYSSTSVLGNTGYNESVQTIAAYQYLRTLLGDIITNTPVANSRQNPLSAVPQVFGTGGTSAEVTLSNEKIDLILNIIQNGTAVITAKTPIGLVETTDSNILAAAALIRSNINFIKAEVTAYINATNFVFDREKCARDIGFIVDSVSFDLLYGGNKQTIQSGVYYYGYNNTSVLGNTGINETPQVLAAYNRIKTIISDIIHSKPLDITYQSAVQQQFGTSGSFNEIAKAEQSVDLITRIILNGPSAASKKEPIGLRRSSDPEVIAAATLLRNNRAFIQAEVIAYANTLTNFVYDQEKCRRDLGYIIDSVAFDLLHGGTKQSIKSGVYYLGYSNNSVLSANQPQEIPQVTAAYNFIKSLIPSIVKSQPITAIYQSGVPQVLSENVASDIEVAKLQSKIDVITDIVRNGPDVVAEQVPISLEKDSSYAIDYAYNLLVQNKNFIAAEVLAYIDQQFNYFDYSREFCRRDVGILVENVSYDVAFGGNQKSVESGLAYFNGVVSKIAGQETQTVSAIDYLNYLAQNIIDNKPVTIQPGTLSQQIINTELTGGKVASNSLDSLFDIITTIIANGPSAAPAIYTSTGPDAAFVSAEVLMQANRQFIQENTVNYVNWNLTNKQFPYSKIKCKRDTGLIVDSIALDLLYPTAERSQSTFAGLQYWNQAAYTGDISNELGQTIDAIKYLKLMTSKIVLNITKETDEILGIDRYSSGLQITDIQPATETEVATIEGEYDLLLEILTSGNAGWTDRIAPNGDVSTIVSVKHAVDLMQANKEYLKEEVVSYIDYFYPGYDYGAIGGRNICKRDIGYIIDSICFDLLHGGNKQIIQSGLYYYGTDSSVVTNEGQSAQTTAAFNRLSSIIPNLLTNTLVQTSTGTTVEQIIDLPAATSNEIAHLVSSINTITSIITNGPSVAPSKKPITLIASNTSTVRNAYDILQANREFIVDDVIHYIDNLYNPNAFEYDEALCYRDVGLIVDAVSQDILLGGNQKSIDCGKAYWSAGYNYVSGQETTTTMAINYAKNMALEIISNRPVEVQSGTNVKQIINPYFQYGGDYMPQQAVKRNFNIISTIVQNGPEYAPPSYAGGGLFALTGISVDQVQISPQVVSVSTISEDTYLIGLSSPTVGFGNNATLYLGDITTYPVPDDKVPAEWAQRRVDNIGAMGGSLVDGAVISDRSPIQSFVYDAFTQVSQGGRGIHITNDGYAQLVSVFTIFCSIGVQVDNGGIASILNSNNNFGDLCLVAKGFGKRKFTGHVYNPVNKAYPESPVNGPGKEVISGSDELDLYYPAGFWPNNAQVRVFLPDLDDRPHISLIMEVEPPEGHLNEREFPGFLNATPNTGILSTGSITINDIDTDGIAIGNYLFIRDKDDNRDYVATGTVVTDVGYRSVTLSKPLIKGGQDPTNFTFNTVNDNWFELYFCGNAYYTVLSSTVSANPQYNRKNQLIPLGANVLSTAATGWEVDQVQPHAEAIRLLNTLTLKVINNEPITPSVLNTTTVQITDTLVTGGIVATPFINLRFNDVINILTASTVEQAESVIPLRLRAKTGTIPAGAGSAVSLINKNIDFLSDEVSAYIKANYFGTYDVNTESYTGGTYGTLTKEIADYIERKCQRDTKIILNRLVYDLQSGGNYNSVMTGLSYWNRSGTYHLVQMGENVRRPDLFPDGSTVNFYQRSYMSASGYVFEYVGAGTNYGALPQVGRADPVQGKETVQVSGGKVFFTSTDQNGDFRIGPGLVISQATGVLSGRTFTKSLFANMTPFILAIESGGA